MREILDRIHYKPSYGFEAQVIGDVYMLRVSVVAPCTDTGFLKAQRGRWLVVEDPNNTDEVVRTAYQACYLFELHEFQEQFKFDGKPFNPPPHH